MKKLLVLVFFLSASVVGFAQYNHITYGANGNKIAEGQYSADPGIQPNDSKQTIAEKMAVVHKTGAWKYWYDNGQLASQETYDNNGLPTGVWKSWYNDGTVSSEINYTAGTAVFYHPNGAKAEEGHVNSTNQRVGEWQGWHDNGNINYTGTFNTIGQKDGVWRFYDANGTLTTTQNFKNDVLTN